jgi:peptide/nickel transport system ATP-binding protein
MTTSTPILKTEGLKKHFIQNDSLVDTLLRRDSQPLKAVDDVSLEIHKNEIKGVIGESGCGKTTLLHTLVGLQEPTGGEVYFHGDPVSEFDKQDWKRFRRNVQIVFQDPFNSLDPKLRVAETLRGPLNIHGLDNKAKRVERALERAELYPPEQYLQKRPHEMSGGEKQRVSIARALVLEPDILLADEPVSMLDVSTQAAILKLLSRLCDDLGMALFYISHDISTIGYLCRQLNVMYLGRIVERGPTRQLIHDPKHPYTQALIDAIPDINPHNDRERTQIEGTPSDPIGLGEGCRFRDRCPECMDICERTPDFVEAENGSRVACHLYYDHEKATQTDERGDPERQESEI